MRDGNSDDSRRWAQGGDDFAGLEQGSIADIQETDAKLTDVVRGGGGVVVVETTLDVVVDRVSESEEEVDVADDDDDDDLVSVDG